MSDNSSLYANRRGRDKAVPAPAKINLYLKVLGRRPDGYHELDTVMARLDLADRLLIGFTPGASADRLGLLASSADIPPDFTGRSNLILKAIETFRQKTGWPETGVDVRLEKNIPLGAGLGGGSSNCAAALILLNRFAPEPLNDDELRIMGLSLGADVPFFLQPEPLVRARGVGQEFSPPPTAFAHWPGRRITLINPGLQLSTAEVFKNWDLTNSPANNNLGPISPPGPGENDLLASAKNLLAAASEVGDAIEALEPQAWGLSGSGPTFWLYSPLKPVEALAAEHPGWRIHETKIQDF